ncbi:MAG: hypothetical protein JSW06_10645 [Thermoplasmatales archaeon]|nr:MAG: hypothetical protein JSW06_10645 [Thermoplasmatales archaeon]
MKKIPILVIVVVLVLSGLGAVAQNSDVTEFDFQTIDVDNTSGGNRDYTHTVLVEVGTATWCPSCPASNTAWHNIYESGIYDFEYTELVSDMNSVADARFNEFNPRWVPTSYWDGGEFVYPGTSVPTFQNYLDASGSRVVPDLVANLDVTWLGSAEMEIGYSVVNNEGSNYPGRLRIYVIELVSRWNDYNGNTYYHAFLDFAVNQVIDIPPSGTLSDTIVWDGGAAGYPDITSDNIQVILAVFDDEPHQSYSDPPSGNPFWAYYVDETISATPSTTGAPNKPNPPSGPTSGEVNVEYSYTGSTTDPDGDDIYYLFDWGDGTDSGWLGPYASGAQVEASHAWTYGDTFDVRLKAKDTVDGQWSDPLSVEISGPTIEIGSIKGGLLKTSTVIQNDGEIELTGVSWKITLHGGVFIGGESTGEDLTVPANGEATIQSGLIFGFGQTNIKVEAWIEDGPSDLRQQDGFVLLFFVKVNPSGGI